MEIGWRPKYVERMGAGAKAVHSRIFSTCLSDLVLALCDHNIPDATVQEWRNYSKGMRMFYGGCLTTAQVYEAQSLVDSFIRHLVCDLNVGDLLPPNYHLLTHIADSVMQNGDVRMTAL